MVSRTQMKMSCDVILTLIVLSQILVTGAVDTGGINVGGGSSYGK